MGRAKFNDAMEIQDLHDDHVEYDRSYDKMIFSLGSRKAWQAEREVGDEQWVDSASLKPGLLRTMPYLHFPTRRQMGFFGTLQYLFLLIASLWVIPTSAVQVNFQNCLSESVLQDSPLQLQLVPLVMDAVFNTTDPMHNLNVTVWTNVTGSTVGPTRYVLPAWNSSYWDTSNDTDAGGKIEANPDPTAAHPLLTTLFSKVNVLTYTPYNPIQGVGFCDILVNGSCPLPPNFKDNLTTYRNFPSYGFSNNFDSSYAFTSFSVTLLVKYGDVNSTPVGCVSANITPDIGSSLSSIVKYIPVVVLLVVGFATAFAGIFSPWGTTDIFRWTTNYGRDADLLRLVTPGFGDCLQYIQFVALTGGLTLNYPGFYQPIVSKVSWSALMFNQSFVSHGNGTNSLVDGIYVTNGTYGLDQLRQLVGMSQVDDVWAGMAVWLLVILGASMAFIQIGFFVRWVYRHVNKTQEEDLRAKNMPFSVGNVIRIVFNYFLLPIVALSMFQLVEAGHSPTYAVALAVVMLVVVVGFACWLLFVIASTRPKSYLFDDLPTVLLYGSLYNTYSDNAAPFALVPLLLTFVRGIAIGAVQPSGIAQLVLLAICEVITVVTLHAFRPFHSPTSMNAFHTFFAVLRFATILLMISFAPSLGITEGSKGWIGYAILLMHAIVLLFGFLLNAVQTIVEVAARMAGAGGDESGATRGGLVKVFGMRQLSRRLPRRDGGSRQSQLSNAAMLDSENDRKAYMMDSGRLRSQSAGSAGVLLGRASTGLDSIDAHGIAPQGYIGSGASSHAPTTPGEASTFSYLPSAASPSGLGRGRAQVLGIATTDTADPYYRPPRLRRPTLETFTPGAKSRASWASRDVENKRWSEPDSGTPDIGEEGPSISGRNTPTAAQMLEGSPGRTQADYTTREVDFYYGVRGRALNANIPSRRIKTGPADPTGPAASAAGWFKNLFGGKTKKKGKGFEVVRSARMPPGMVARNVPGAETPPEGVPVAFTGGVRNGPIESDDESIHAGPSRAATKPAAATTHENENLVSSTGSDDESASDDEYEITRISDMPPSIGLDIPDGGIELPSRFPSKATSKGSTRRGKATDIPDLPGLPTRMPSAKPNLPRKSSRRKSQSVDMTSGGAQFLQTHQPQRSLDSRLPFDRTNSQKRQSDMSSKSGATDPLDLGNQSVLGRISADDQNDRPTSVGYVNQHSIRTVNPSENPQYLGSSAELVDGRLSGSSSMENAR